MNHQDDEVPTSAIAGAVENPLIATHTIPNRSTLVLRPTGVTVLGVLCTIAGILGLFSSLFALVNIFFGQQFASLFNQSGPFQDAQTEMNQAMATVLAKYFYANLFLSIGGFVLSVLVLAGGIGALMGRAWSRTLLRRTLLLMILFEIFKAVIYAFTQSEIMPITQRYMEQIAGGADLAAQFSTIMIVVGIVFWVGSMLVKITLMVWGRRYLGKQHLDSYFGT